MRRSRRFFRMPCASTRGFFPFALATALWLTACGGGGDTTVVNDTGGNAPDRNGWTWRLPDLFPAPKVPDDNPMTEAKVALGRYLFYDARLSGNGTQSCASCHHQDKAFTDGLARSIGSTGLAHPRNAQSLVNVVYLPTLTWANPALVRLEKQMEIPLFGDDPVEMGVNDHNKDEVLGRLQSDAQYRQLFAKAYPAQQAPLNWANAIAAIASFQRSILSGNSLYDRYLRGEAQLSAAQTRGMNLFFGEKAECFHCHSSFNFNDQIIHANSRLVDTPFHNTGLYNIDGQGRYPESLGAYEITFIAGHMGAFRAPSLRNVEVTGPYMHDGSVATLEEVVATYAAGGRNITEGPYRGDGRANPYKNDFIGQIDLDTQEQSDIVAFLKSLTDHELLTHPAYANPFTAKDQANAQP